MLVTILLHISLSHRPNMLKYLLLLLLIFIHLQSTHASYFQEVDGDDMIIFEEHNSKSYNLFADNIQSTKDKIYLKFSSSLSFAQDIKYGQYSFKQNGYPIPASIAIGIKFSKFLNLELYGESRINQDMKLIYNTDYVTYRLGTYGGGAFLSMDMLQSYDFVPYIGAGCGVYWNDWKITEQTTKFNSEADIEQKVILNYRFAIGARYKINQNLYIFGEYSYRKIGDLKEENLFSNDFILGMMLQ
jgi:opacity protein-like surface antigen